MRVTVLDNEPGRKINPERERYYVFLDGVEVKHCFTADDIKGEVVEAVTDAQGRMIAGKGEVKRRTRHGKVIIENAF